MCICRIRRHTYIHIYIYTHFSDTSLHWFTILRCSFSVCLCVAQCITNTMFYYVLFTAEGTLSWVRVWKDFSWAFGSRFFLTIKRFIVRPCLRTWSSLHLCSSIGWSFPNTSCQKHRLNVAVEHQEHVDTSRSRSGRWLPAARYLGSSSEAVPNLEACTVSL